MSQSSLIKLFALYLIETPFNTCKQSRPRSGSSRAALSWSTLFACGNMIRCDPTLVDLTSTCNFFYLRTNVKVYVSILSVGGA